MVLEMTVNTTATTKAPIAMTRAEPDTQLQAGNFHSRRFFTILGPSHVSSRRSFCDNEEYDGLSVSTVSVAVSFPHQS